jgi:hypothetical protein
MEYCLEKRANGKSGRRALYTGSLRSTSFQAMSATISSLRLAVWLKGVHAHEPAQETDMVYGII